MRALLILLFALGVAACDGKPPAPKAAFAGTDITGLEYGKGLELTDHTGQRRTLADYRGKVVAVFFGYTQCPDVCPTTLAELAQIKKQLGADGDKLQVVFITVDHTAGTYLFDQQGRIRLFVRHVQDPQSLLQDIRLLLANA